MRDIALRALEEARRSGATGADVSVTRSEGLSVTVRLGEVETVEHNRDKGLSVTVYVGNRTGNASTSDFADAAVVETVRAACSIAKYTAEDPCAGLPDAARLATSPIDLDLNHPWDLSVDEAIAIAQRCEDAARGADDRISNSEGATVNTYAGSEVYASSLGFIGETAGSRHSISCAVIGSQDAAMQRDYWYTTARAAEDLLSPEEVGLTAARRTVRRLGARRLSTCRVPVLYEAPIASGLLSHLVAASRGSNLYRGASFLCDQRGNRIFPEWVRIHEQPHLPRAVGSAWFDNEGVATAARDIIAGGVLQGYVLDTYSACKLHMDTTGNAGGVRNLAIDPSAGDLEDMLRRLDRGLLVTELIGHGVNIVTGDYSRGAVGFWVENGEIQYPVEEITVAGNLRDMYRSLTAAGGDVDTRGNLRSGSLLIEQMTVAGT